MSQLWSRWYTEERLQAMKINELARHFNTVSNALAAFEKVPDANAEQIKELKAVKWLIEETIRNKV